jgi:hypothetical protein
MTSVLRGIASIGVVAVLLGCQSATEPFGVMLRIEPTQASYIAGSTVFASLRNVGAEEVSYNACGSRLQRLANRNWVDLGTTDAGCLDSASPLQVGISVLERVGALPADLAPGTYRYELRALTTAGRAIPGGMRSSAAFIVIEPDE